MANIVTFVNGTEGSASDWQDTIDTVQGVGSGVLSGLNDIRSQTLIDFQRRVASINSKLYVSKSVADNNAVAIFPISDFNLIDQAETTATVRIDSGAATLSERTLEVDAVIKSVNFSASIGSIETIDSNYNIYRVYNTQNQIPTGTFDIVLRSSLNLSVIVFDLAAFAGQPDISIQTSNTGLIYQDVSKSQLNGYRLIAWLPSTDVKYIRLKITPSIPDNLGGSLYTFGLTDFSASSTQFRLLSEFVSKPVQFVAESSQVQLVGTEGDGLVYFLSINGSQFSEVANNGVVSLPSLNTVSLPGCTIDSSGNLNATLPQGTPSQIVQKYTIQVVDESTGLQIPIVRGILPTDPNKSHLSRDFISIVNHTLIYITPGPLNTSKTFRVSYLYGQINVTATLKVQLSSNSNNSSPIFNGASLLKV